MLELEGMDFEEFHKQLADAAIDRAREKEEAE